MTSVFAAYVTTTGAVWVDFDIYMTKRWADDASRRARAGVPQDLAFTTKPDLTANQLRRLTATGLRFGGVAGDEVYGRSTRLRATCTELGLTGVFIVPTTFTITTPAGATATVAQVGTDAVLERRLCGTGTKGPRLFDWALVGTDDPCQVLLIRRLITHPDQPAYFICHVPDPTTIRLPYLATIAGRRRPVEETFKLGKDVLGWDQSQTRTHTALAALRQVTARTLHITATPAQQPPHPEPVTSVNPADLRIPFGDSPVPTTLTQHRPPELGYIRLSVGEHHRLHTLALTKTAGLLTIAADAFHLTWSRRRRRHQATARWHHYRRHLRLAPDPT